MYNAGEPINAMTSPLHAVLSAALFFVTGNTVLSYKIISLVLLFLSALLVWYRYREHLHWQVLALILLIPPCVLLWTFGGLETPILLFLATITVILADRPPPFRLNLLCVIFLLAGLAFLTRYDSILFFLPVTLYVASKARSVKDVVIALAGAVILPLVWIFISIYYYGDLLPTSFYVKTPTGKLWDLIRNGKYIASYLLYIGIIPAAALVFVLLVPKHRTIGVLYRHFKSIWWLREVDLTMGRPAYLFTGFLLCLTLFQLYQNVYTYNHSVNGISSIGEYKDLGIRDYVGFIQILKQEALDIEKHWEVINGNSGRRPRIITFAAGMLPYTFRDSYIYEQLLSYRHCHQRYKQGLYADYVHILAPRQGSVDQQLPRSEDSYYLVSDYEMFFDGSMQKFLVYYNPKPEAHNLSVGINDFCQQGAKAVN